MRFDEFGRELPDNTPIAKPLKWNRPGSTLDEIRRNLQIASREAQQQGMETFDEADDFDIGDDVDHTHPFAERVDNLNREFEEIRAAVRAAKDRGELELTEDGTWIRPRQPVKTPTPPAPVPSPAPAPTNPPAGTPAGGPPAGS